MNGSEQKLPKGWRWARLGEVCHFINGDAYKESDWRTEGVPIIRIQNLNDKDKPFNYWSGTLGDRVCVNNGDLLLAWSGTPGTSFGAHIWERGPGVLNQHIFLVQTSEVLEKVWARWAINEALDELIKVAHGAVGLAHVTKREVEALAIPLPPLSEQRRIAGALKDQMTVVEKARAAAEARLEAVKALPAALLHEAFSHERTKQWRVTTVNNISSLIIDGPHVTPSYVTQGIPFVTVRNIQSGRINFDNLSYISEEDHRQFSRRGKAEKGDILYTKDGTLGIPCVVDTDVEFSFFVSVALIKLRCEVVDPEFIAYAMKSRNVLQQVKRLGSGAGLKHMVLKSIRALEIPCPALDEQQHIVAEIHKQMSLVEIARTASEWELKTINALPAALLRRAFGGGL